MGMAITLSNHRIQDAVTRALMGLISKLISGFGVVVFVWPFLSGFCTVIEERKCPSFLSNRFFGFLSDKSDQTTSTYDLPAFQKNIAGFRVVSKELGPIGEDKK